MPRQSTITIPPNVWTEITNTDATVFSLQVLSGAIHLEGAVGAVPPTSFDGSFFLREGQPPLIGVSLPTMFNGVVGTNRLYAHGDGNSATIVISHN